MRNSPPAAKLEQTGVRPECVSESPRNDHYRQGKEWLHVAPKKGKAFDQCASLDHRYICCGTHVLRALSNCPYECSYCFLQDYLTDSTTWVIGESERLLDEVREKTARHPWRFFRVGTWELGDSLALEPLVGTAQELVRGFAAMPNALLELKTKSDTVDGLLDLPHNGRTVVSWTMNPEAVVRTEELRTASVEARIGAMRNVAEAGYPVGIHFDPIILHEGWEEAYEGLVERIFEAASPERVAWISIGSLRFNPEMKRAIEANYPGSRITSAEMVLGDDGKMRYVKPIRLQLYDHVYRAIRRHAGGEVFVYLCMERPEVWERVFGESPRSVGHHDYLFTKSLGDRFPGLVHEEPILEKYEGAYEERPADSL
jgi:spore photoproduct lyase